MAGLPYSPGMISNWTEHLKDWAVGIVAGGGYYGLFVLMMLSAANVPIPSEAVLPFAGLLAAGQGAVGQPVFNIHVVALVATVATSIGSLISYGLGAWLGKDFLLKYGKYMFLRAKEIEHGEEWFLKYGLTVTLWGRMIPLVRSFVSLPAGLYKANLARFLLYSFVGTLPWSYGWALVGFYLGKNWTVVTQNAKWIDVAVLIVLAAILLRVVLRRRSREQNEQAP